MRQTPGSSSLDAAPALGGPSPGKPRVESKSSHERSRSTSMSKNRLKKLRLFICMCVTISVVGVAVHVAAVTGRASFCFAIVRIALRPVFARAGGARHPSAQLLNSMRKRQGHGTRIARSRPHVSMFCVHGNRTSMTGLEYPASAHCCTVVHPGPGAHVGHAQILTPCGSTLLAPSRGPPCPDIGFAAQSKKQIVTT